MASPHDFHDPEKNVSSAPHIDGVEGTTTSRHHNHPHHRRDLEREGELSGYTLEINATPSSHTEKAIIEEDDSSTQSKEPLKLAKDGHTILIPQPSDDPNDPLNWSLSRKFVILFVISATAFLPGMSAPASILTISLTIVEDYGSATGAVTLLQQATLWNMTPDVVNHSQVGNVFMLGMLVAYLVCDCTRVYQSGC